VTHTHPVSVSSHPAMKIAIANLAIILMTANVANTLFIPPIQGELTCFIFNPSTPF
jgi:hypothetical protein